MPNDTPYSLAHTARKGPKITMGKGMHRIEPENKSKMVIEPPTPEQLRQEEIKERGGEYSDRIKIEPKFNAPPRTAPPPSDAVIQRILTSQKTKI